MENLTIEQLAPYLPYDLKVKLISDNRNYKVGNIYTLSIQLLHDKFKNHTNNDIFKPILHDLSSLTKEITVDGETFIPMVKLCNDFCGRIPCNPEFGKSKILMHADNGGGLKWWFVYHRNTMTFELSDDNKDMANYTIPQYKMFQKLFEWHFNVFNIPSHLYINKLNLK